MIAGKRSRLNPSGMPDSAKKSKTSGIPRRNIIIFDVIVAITRLSIGNDAFKTRSLLPTIELAALSSDAENQFQVNTPITRKGT
jgi:hypothetical protein